MPTERNGKQPARKRRGSQPSKPTARKPGTRATRSPSGRKKAASRTPAARGSKTTDDARKDAPPQQGDGARRNAKGRLEQESAVVDMPAPAAREPSGDGRGAVEALSSAPLRRAREWFAKRGVLFLLTQTPMIALLVGYFLRWMPYSSAMTFFVVPSMILIPVWILYRQKVSDDKTEPSFRFTTLALWALVPYVVYNIARVPMHYALDIVFWDHWYDFGSEMTGQPVDQWGSLFPGTLLHSLQGYVLALGYFILFPRVTLLNALGYVFVFLSAVYSWTFPTFVLVDFQPPPKWFFVVWWAHFWMAIAAWAMPRIRSYGGWKRFRPRWASASFLVLTVFLYVSPFAFVFWRVQTWQFDYQRRIDTALFDRTQLTLTDPLLAAQRVQETGETVYRMQLRLGPRIYRDYINAQKALDAGPVRISGVVLVDRDPVAWCSSFIPEIATPNKILRPAQYFPALRRMEYTDMEVACVGAGASLDALDALDALDRGRSSVQLRWVADVLLVGDREKDERRFEGYEQNVRVVTP